MKAKVQKKLADLGDGFGFRNTGFFQSIEILIGESQDKLVHSGGPALAGRQSREAFASLANKYREDSTAVEAIRGTPSLPSSKGMKSPYFVPEVAPMPVKGSDAELGFSERKSPLSSL